MGAIGGDLLSLEQCLGGRKKSEWSEIWDMRGVSLVDSSKLSMRYGDVWYLLFELGILPWRGSASHMHV